MARNVVTQSNRASRIEGLPELLAQVNALKSAASGPQAKAVFAQGGRVLADEMRRRAAWRHVREAVFVTNGRSDQMNVLVGIAYRKAPDVFWLEFGTYKHDARRPKKARFLRFQIDGKWIFVKQVANLQPKPFFRPAIAAKRSEIAAIMAEGFRKMIEAAAA